jgi:hypothetical protein
VVFLVEVVLLLVAAAPVELDELEELEELAGGDECAGVPL